MAGEIHLWIKAQKKTSVNNIIRTFAHKKTMFPIYRKNHIWSSISRSPDLRSLLRNSFPDWRLPLQWIMFRNSLSQWRDRTGIRPVSLLIRVFKIKNILLELIEAGSKPTNVIWFAFQAYIIFCVLSSFFLLDIVFLLKQCFMGTSHVPAIYIGM